MLPMVSDEGGDQQEDHGGFNVTVPTGLGTGDLSLRAGVGRVQSPLGVLISLQ